MTKKIPKKSIIIVLVLSTLVYYGYQRSCLKNHSDTINELGKPIVQNVLAFFKENQRYPDLKESEVIFKKAGCSNIKQRKYKESKNIKGEIYERWASYDCDFKSRAYAYGLTVGDLTVEKNRTYSENSPFRFGFSKGNTRCSARLYKDGTTRREYISCHHDSCINLSH